MKKIDSIWDVINTLKYKKPTAIFCPKCADPNLKLHSSLDLWLTPPQYICNKCGYLGPIFMELEKEENKEGIT